MRHSPAATLRAVAIFGVPDDPREAGYILADGQMLDFSGRRLGNAPSGQRAEDHRAIYEVYPRARFDHLTDAMLRFMAEEEAVRIGFRLAELGLDFIEEVTRAQERTIRDLLHYTRKVIADRVNKDRHKRDVSTEIFQAPFFWPEVQAFLRGEEEEG